MQLYIHIPFCKQKCLYCDFNSYANVDDGAKFSYLSALNREIRLAAEKYGSSKIDTVYIGGGTPSVLEENSIKSLVKALKSAFSFENVKEFTIECNPESVSEEKLELYKELGINRISIGVQSLLDENLRAIRRLHDRKTAISTLELAGKYFDNVSCDVIVGLPFDTLNSAENELRELAGLVKHISVYALTLEENTPLAKKVKDGGLLLPDDDETEDMLETAERVLADCGLYKYEVSNYAREGFESKHNSGYWTGEEYLGFGAGAHSYIKTIDGQNALTAPIRFSEPKNLNAYIAGINCAESFDMIPRMDMQALSEVDIWNEKIMLGLRMKKGVESELLAGRIPAELEGYFVSENGRTALTPRGMAVMNSILIRIMRFD